MDRWEIRDVIAEEDDDIPDGCMTPNRKVSSASKSEIAKAKRNSRVDIPELGLDSGRINRRTSLKRYESKLSFLYFIELGELPLAEDISH